MDRPNFGKADGLIRAIAQDFETRDVLMDAFMNEEAFDETLRTGRAVYYSRSRQKLWRKGEESGNVQLVKEIRINCYGDSLLLFVEQVGGDRGVIRATARAFIAASRQRVWNSSASRSSILPRFTRNEDSPRVRETALCRAQRLSLGTSLPSPVDRGLSAPISRPHRPLRRGRRHPVSPARPADDPLIHGNRHV